MSDLSGYEIAKCVRCGSSFPQGRIVSEFHFMRGICGLCLMDDDIEKICLKFPNLKVLPDGRVHPVEVYRRRKLKRDDLDYVEWYRVHKKQFSGRTKSSRKSPFPDSNNKLDLGI